MSRPTLIDAITVGLSTLFWLTKVLRRDKKSLQASRKIKKQFDRRCSMIMEKQTQLQ